MIKIAYITTQDIVRKTGVGVEINNELLGTGDSSERSYDLNNRHIVANSYTLSYAAASGATTNVFTDLTESTHYTLDKDSGRVVLTTDGTSAVAKNKLYAKYIHSPKVSDTILDSYIAEADEEVDRSTGAYWGTPASRTNYVTGRRQFPYPKTDRPYDRRDFDENDHVQLDRRNVTEVNEVSFLARGVSLASVQSFTDSGSTYVDNTEEANSPTGSSFAVFGSTAATSDIIYIGMAHKFHGLTTNLATTGAGSPTLVWEYWNGTAWTDFTSSITEVTSNASIFTAAGKFTWTSLSGWTTVSVNSSTAVYFVRGRFSSGSYTTDPAMFSVYADQDSVISQEIPLYDIDFKKSGRVTFLNHRMQDGTRNIKIVFKHGQTTTIKLIGELSALYAGLRVYANISGGSYDDETGVTIGGVSVSIGEVYTNVREVTRQFEVRIQAILRQLGKRIHLVA